MEMIRFSQLAECEQCGGTGVYSGMAESDDCAVVCSKCNGKGSYIFKVSLHPFNGRKQKKGIKRVYLRGTQYKIGLGVIDYDGVGKIDMDKEGVSYDEFLDGKMPKYLKKLGCPLMADQGACHKINGFVDKCNDLNGGWISMIPSCKNKHNSLECWERFEGLSK